MNDHHSIKRQLFFVEVIEFLSIILLLASLFHDQCEAQIFSKVSSSLSPGSLSCGWIDFNNDNYLDAYQATFYNLYSNNKDGSFRLADSCALSPSHDNSITSGFCWGDYDNNGFPDLYITNYYTGENVLYSNSGNGHFQKITNTDVTKDRRSSMDANWVDFNNDGYLDLLVTASGTDFTAQPGRLNLFYINNGDGTFSKLTDNAVASTPTLSDCAAFADYDNDGDQDLFMTQWFTDNWLFENNGDGSFKKISGQAINSNTDIAITASWGDYDNDGYLDLFVGNGTPTKTLKQKNKLFHNNGDKTFTKITTGAIVNDLNCAWTSAWGDVDNDGDLDLYVGTIYDREELLYMNNGDGTFTRASGFAVDTSSHGTGITGVCFGDYDNDGFLDVQVADARGALLPFIYHNNGNGNHWINISCQGTISNRSAIGARVKVKAVIFGKTIWQMREINTKQGFRGSNDLRAHFGLGDAAVIDSLVIDWPSGARTIRTHVSTNAFLSITEEIPANYLKPVFFADVVKGKGSLVVHFTDKSIADTNNPITSWSWDFDNDGKQDSYEQNPIHIFKNDTGAAYSVSLTISNGTTSKTTMKKDLITIIPKTHANLALFAKVTASSSESDGYPPANVVDGDIFSRWSSQFKDPQWIMVELDTISTVGKVVLRWENSFGRQYTIQAALDTSSWETVYTETRGNGVTDTLIFSPVKAKFVRMYGTRRATTYGYSLYEFEIYSSTATHVNESERIPSGFKLNQNYPNPFNPETAIGYRLPEFSKVKLKVSDILGKEVAVLVDREQPAGSYEIKFIPKSLSSGIYFYTLHAGSFAQTNKMLLLR